MTERMLDIESDGYEAERARRKKKTKSARIELLEAYWHCDHADGCFDGCFDGLSHKKKIKKIRKVLDELLTADDFGEGDKNRMEQVAKSYWQLYEDLLSGRIKGRVEEWLEQNSRSSATVHEFPEATH